MECVMALKRTARGRADTKMKRKDYEKELRKLQSSFAICRSGQSQGGAHHPCLRAATLGGTIKAITERVSPRVFRVVALPAPSDREKTQMFMQRYVQQFPAAGEIVIFDRSWYNRAGVDTLWAFAGTPTLIETMPGNRKIHRGWRHPAHQDLA
jgi:polyphosphate kinase